MAFDNNLVESLKSEHAGLHVFSEAFSRFEFADTIKLPTRYCQHLLTGSDNVQMNYVYNLNFDQMSLLEHELMLLKEVGFPMTVLCDEASGMRHKKELEDIGLTFICTVQSKIKSLREYTYTLSENIIIKEVTTPQMLDSWRRIAAESFEYPYGCDDGLFMNFLHPGEHHNRIKLYLAYINNTAVGQSMLYLGDTYSGNLWSSVLPAYRNQGVLSEMLKYRLDVAKRLGFGTNVVQCMPSSASVYDRQGYNNIDVLALYTLNSK